MSRRYYLTCSYDPPKKKAQKKCWQSDWEKNWSSLFLVLRWVVYYTCFTLVNVISLSDSAKLAFMFPHEFFQPWSTGIMWKKCHFDNHHWNKWIWQVKMNIIKNTLLFSFQFRPGRLKRLPVTLKLSVSWTTTQLFKHFGASLAFFFGCQMISVLTAYSKYLLFDSENPTNAKKWIKQDCGVIKAHAACAMCSVKTVCGPFLLHLDKRWKGCS